MLSKEKILKTVLETINSEEYYESIKHHCKNVVLNNNKINISTNKKKLYIKLAGGIGNQLFMLFNGLSLAYDNNFDPILITRFDSTRYPIFKDNAFIIEIKFAYKFTNSEIIKEKSYEHNDEKKVFDENKNYALSAEISGYFQSYKYFWHNIDKIKKKFNISEQRKNKITNVLTKINKGNKRTIGIHVRLTDYTKLKNYHYNVPAKYYESILKKYNLDDYVVVLFSDDVTEAHKLLKSSLNDIDIVYANNVCDDDYDELLLLSYCDIKICPNSTFSLWACYLNEIFCLNVNTNSKYVFPDVWFGPAGPNYDIYDIVPINNKRYEIMVIEPKIYGIFLIATGKYISFLDDIIQDIKDNFLTQEKKLLLISTDNVEILKKYDTIMDDKINYVANYIPCRGFPADTMYRFEYFLNFSDMKIDKLDIKNINDIDHLLFMNINLRFNEKVDSLSLKEYDFFGVVHPGKTLTDKMFMSLESRKECGAYVDSNKNRDIPYICGGVNGGKTQYYLEMARELKQLTEIDDNKNIIAKWHDESYINYYYSKNKKKFKILSYYYCNPYIKSSYIYPTSKSHDDLRKNGKLVVNYCENINNDLLRILYCMDESKSDISLLVLNKKYNNSSRQGLLKNFFRIDLDSCNMEKVNKTYISDFKKYTSNCNDIQIYDSIFFELVENKSAIQSFISKLNVCYSEDELNKFIEKYKNHYVIHPFSEKHNDFIKKCVVNNIDKNFLLIIQDTKDKTNFDKYENVISYCFDDQEKKIIYLSKLSSHIFFDLCDIFMILSIERFKFKKNFIKVFTSNKNRININLLNNVFEKEISYIDDACNLVSGYKCAVIFFHKNMRNLYKSVWIEKCIDSVLSQKCDFDIYETNYGNTNESIFKNRKINKNINFYVKDYETHTEAMIFLLNKCFVENDYDIVFNVNLDDYYHENRFLYQMNEISKGNYLTSSLWSYVEENNDGIDVVYRNGANHILCENDKFVWHNSYKRVITENDYQGNIPYDSIKKNLLLKHNIINHSGACFSRNFWLSKDKYENYLRYRSDKPYEDLSLWYRALNNNIPISIINKNLVYYRIHNNQIGSQKKKLIDEKIKQKDFKDGPNLNDFEIGILFKMKDSTDFIKIQKLETNFFSLKKKFYFLFIKTNMKDQILSYLKNQNIKNYEIKLFSEETCFEEIIKTFDVSLEINSDYILYANSCKDDFFDRQCDQIRDVDNEVIFDKTVKIVHRKMF